MDNLRFVLESPQTATSQKKRPRLVTSCDNCRLKKIKCVQSRNREKCEACETGGIACEYRDRERYFAERSRIVSSGSATGASNGASYSRRSSRSPPYPSQPSPSPSTTAGWYSSSPAPDANQLRYMSSSPAYGALSSSSSVAGDWFTGEAGQMPPTYYSGSHRDRYNSLTLAEGQPHSTPTSGYPSCLFDQRRPQFPDSSLMQHYLQYFFQHLGQTFPFLSSAEVTTNFYEGSLSALLSNAIAALTARYGAGQLSPIMQVGVTASIKAYCDMARSLVSQTSFTPYMEILHAVILLAWAELKCSYIPGCAEYTQMASKMAIHLGLQHGTTSSGTSARVAQMHRDTWASVVQLQQRLAETTQVSR